MFAVGCNVNAEIFVSLGIRKSVMPFQTVDLRFANRRNLTFVGVESSQAFGGRSSAAYRAKSVDQILRLPFLGGIARIER